MSHGPTNPGKDPVSISGPVSGVMSTSGIVDVSGPIGITGTVNTSGTVNNALSGVFSASGIVDVSGPIGITGTVNTSGTVNNAISGVVSTSGIVDVSGPVAITGTVNTSGTVNNAISGVVSTSGIVDVSGPIGITGTVNTSGTVNNALSGVMSVSGPVTSYVQLQTSNVSETNPMYVGAAVENSWLSVGTITTSYNDVLTNTVSTDISRITGCLYADVFLSITKGNSPTDLRFYIEGTDDSVSYYAIRDGWESLWIYDDTIVGSSGRSECLRIRIPADTFRIRVQAGGTTSSATFSLDTFKIKQISFR